MIDYDDLVFAQRGNLTYLVFRGKNMIYFMNTDWLIVFLFVISKLILIAKLVVIWFSLLRLINFYVKRRNIHKNFDPAILESDYQMYKSQYTWRYQFSKSKFFNYIYNKFSAIRHKYDLLKLNKNNLFRCRGGDTDISKNFSVVVESYSNKKSVKTKLQLLINDKILAQFCGILSLSQTGNLVPRILGVLISVVIKTNVFIKPIEDKKFVSEFNPSSSFIEQVEKAQTKISPEICPKQILFIPGPRGTNQVTIVTLESKFKLICSPEKNTGLNSLGEITSTALQLPLDEEPLLCGEEKLSLIQRYKLKESIRSAKIEKQIQYFSEFIKELPQSDADSEVVYQPIVEKIKQ